MPDPSSWHSEALDEQLALQQIIVAPDLVALDARLDRPPTDTTRLQLSLHNLGEYAASWGDPAAEWLVLAVIKLIREICNDYLNVRFGCVPPDHFVMVMDEEHYQEIAHRCVTGYQELYDILLRTHRKPSSPIWHRRAVVQHFPQLIVENDDQGDLISNDDMIDHRDESS